MLLLVPALRVGTPFLLVPPLCGGHTRAGGFDAEHGSDAERRNQDKTGYAERRNQEPG